MKFCLALFLLAAGAGAGEESAAPKKFDWSKPETSKAFWEWTAKKPEWLPKSVQKASFDINVTDGKQTAGVLLESAGPVLEDVKKATLFAANAMGQMLAQGASFEKAGVIVKCGEEMGVVMLPVENLKKLGTESSKGPKADKAEVNKLVNAIMKSANWSEADALAKKHGPAVKAAK